MQAPFATNRRSHDRLFHIHQSISNFCKCVDAPPRTALVEQVLDQLIALNVRPDAGEPSSCYLVNKALDFRDGRIVDRTYCFTTAPTFDRASKAHGFVTDAEQDRADGAFRLGRDIVEFVCHVAIIADD